MDKSYQYQPQQKLSNKQESASPNSTLFSLSHKYVAILVVILCLTSLGSSIYFLTIHNKKDPILTSLLKQSLLLFPSPIPTPQEAPKDADKTSNWNIYSSSKYQYSI